MCLQTNRQKAGAPSSTFCHYFFFPPGPGRTEGEGVGVEELRIGAGQGGPEEGCEQSCFGGLNPLCGFPLELNGTRWSHCPQRIWLMGLSPTLQEDPFAFSCWGLLAPWEEGWDPTRQPQVPSVRVINLTPLRALIQDPGITTRGVPLSPLPLQPQI